MALYNEAAFQRALPAGFDGLFQWGFLDPAWHNAGKPAEKQPHPMDFDAVVERGGRFLIFETKHPGVPIPLGQQLTLQAMVRMAPPGRVCVISLQAKTADGIDHWWQWSKARDGRCTRVKVRGSSADLVRSCRQWFLYCTRNPLTDKG